MEFLAGSLVAVISFVPASIVVIYNVRSVLRRWETSEENSEHWREIATNAIAQVIGNKRGEKSDEDATDGG